MKNFNTFLNEALITFNKKAYPKFGNIVIMAGGAGSGKGFVQETLLGIEGKTLDVDALKKLAINSTKFAAKVKAETGTDIKKFDLRVPENVSKLHVLLNDVYPISDRREAALFKSVVAAAPDRKPNIIFDVTLKDFMKLKNIADLADELGYDKKNVHIVWVVNDVKVAIEQNKNRPRIVPEEILMGTHKGVSNTMRQLFGMGSSLRKYVDGDIWLAFNKINVDSELEVSKRGGSYLKEAFYVKFKQAGKNPLAAKELGAAVINKIKQYVPNPTDWIM